MILQPQSKSQRQYFSCTVAGMARFDRYSRKGEYSSPKAAATEAKLVAFKISGPAPHRQFSLLTITIILNVLLWSSVLCSIIALFQIASDSVDHSNVVPGVMTLVSVSNINTRCNNLVLTLIRLLLPYHTRLSIQVTPSSTGLLPTNS